MLSGFRRRRKTQEQTSRIRRRRRYCSIACRSLREASRELRSRWLQECLWLESWEQRCSAQSGEFDYFCRFDIPQANLSLFPVFCHFPCYLKRSRDFTPDPLVFSTEVKKIFLHLDFNQRMDESGVILRRIPIFSHRKSKFEKINLDFWFKIRGGWCKIPTSVQ